MARLYRSSSALGLKEILARFDCQRVPGALFDYARFRDEYKGQPHKDLVDGLSLDLSKLKLPQFIYADPASSFDASIAEWIEDERAAVATGFSESKYTEDDRIAWVAAEIDSKLEVSPEFAEEWCDRLDAVAKSAQFPKWQIWLISPEGFSPAAIDILRERNACGSSRQQAILLNRFLDPSQQENQKTESNEYEMVVPMGDDTELIAAQTVEEIAKRHNFPQKAINQIKTALVEACINAVEHSLSPDRKIYQKFAVESDRIDITVSNRGLRLADAKVTHAAPTGGRRGWGLTLMKGLMDEVTVERVDDGTRIRMTKFLKTHEK
jgi:serine/threonine-protein kinase RsbW